MIDMACSRHDRVLQACDRLGQKTLVYRWQPGQLLFASELKSLLAAPGVARELDPTVRRSARAAYLQLLKFARSAA